MHLRRWCAVVALVALVALVAAIPRLASAQDRATSSDPMAVGLVPGDYIRVGGGITSPVNPSGSLRDWDRGTSFSVVWENWQPASSGVGRVGFGLGVAYSMLPLNEPQFSNDFTPTTGGTTATASASKAGIIEVTTGIRFRIPAPFVIPSLSLGFGFVDWRPGNIDFTTTTGVSGTTKQQHRSGAEIALGGALDRLIYDRYSIFGEAQYVYGFTSYGSGLAATPGGACVSNGCDVLRNTTIGSLRGGLRVRVGR